MSFASEAVSFLLTAVVKDLRRRLADPIALLIWIGIPVLIGSLLAVATGSGEGGAPRPHLLVADLDSSFLSGLVAGAGGGPLGEALDVEEVSLEEGRRRLDSGEASALLVLPEGFSAAVIEEAPVTIELVKNPAQQILPAMVEEGVEMLVEAIFYLQQLLGEQLRVLARGPPSGASLFADTTVAVLATGVNRKVASVQGLLFPPVLDLEAAEVEGEAAAGGLDFATFFLPGLLFMSLLFVAQGMSDDLWHEKAQGTLRRTLTSPRSTATFLAGKLLAGGAVASAVSAAGAAIAGTAFGVPAARLPAAFLWCAFGGTALLALFLLVQLFATSQRAGSILTTVLIFPLMMIGGSFFPFQLMPEWMAAVGRWTPNGQAVVQLTALLRGTARPGELSVAAAAIGLAAVLAFGLGLRRLSGGWATR